MFPGRDKIMRLEHIFRVFGHEFYLVGYFHYEFCSDRLKTAFVYPWEMIFLAGFARKSLHSDIEKEQIRVETLDLGRIQADDAVGEK